MSVYPKRVYPRGYGFPGVTVNSEDEENRAMGIKEPVNSAAPAVPLSSTSAAKAPAPKKEKKAKKSKRK